jgi:hypothetical protein
MSIVINIITVPSAHIGAVKKINHSKYNTRYGNHREKVEPVKGRKENTGNEKEMIYNQEAFLKTESR